MPVKLRWHIFTLISETSTNNTGVTWSLAFSPNFLPALVLVVTFYQNFIPTMTMARSNPMMTL
jgi:hypothetical protein